ncbi:aminopeptidase [Pedococcus sp. 5OH_020]|uniref:aminopeptidase n=1 Tax=Pedococcus sp. 5OH_020 TaxID=2989814 RepID=UPI0022E9D24D|nr:aminopeptidase [Pedococcus sp. 5OH_020]
MTRPRATDQPTSAPDLMQGHWGSLAASIATGTSIGAGDKVAVALTGIEAYDAVHALVEECHRRGATPQVVLAAEDFERSALALLDIAALRRPAPLELAAIEWADVYIALRAMTVPRQRETGSAPSPNRQVAQRLGKGEVSTARWRSTRWCVVRLPTAAWATRAGADPARIEAEFLAGCTQDWPAWRRRWGILADALDGSSTVTILDEDTDLSLGVRGRTWVPFAGEANLPDGEVATAPLESETNGHISFPGRFWFADTEIADLTLVFENGRCTKADASRGGAFVEQLVAADEGAALVGELGIGLNPFMTTLTGDLFIDEKILGTAHIAMGRAYPQCGGLNESSIHWDIVKDLRTPRASLLVDDVALIDSGRVVGPLAAATEPLTKGS